MTYGSRFGAKIASQMVGHLLGPPVLCNMAWCWLRGRWPGCQVPVALADNVASGQQQTEANDVGCARLPLAALVTRMQFPTGGHRVRTGYAMRNVPQPCLNKCAACGALRDEHECTVPPVRWTDCEKQLLLRRGLAVVMTNGSSKVV